MAQPGERQLDGLTGVAAAAPVGVVGGNELLDVGFVVVHQQQRRDRRYVEAVGFQRGSFPLQLAPQYLVFLDRCVEIIADVRQRRRHRWSRRSGREPLDQLLEPRRLTHRGVVRIGHLGEALAEGGARLEDRGRLEEPVRRVGNGGGAVAGVNGAIAHGQCEALAVGGESMWPQRADQPGHLLEQHLELVVTDVAVLGTPRRLLHRLFQDRPLVARRQLQWNLAVCQEPIAVDDGHQSGAPQRRDGGIFGSAACAESAQRRDCVAGTQLAYRLVPHRQRVVG